MDPYRVYREFLNAYIETVNKTYVFSTGIKKVNNLEFETLNLNCELKLKVKRYINM
jgi:hypothetical protein